MQKSQLKSELKLRAMFENTLNPIFVFDGEYRYIDANRAGLDFLECNKQELSARCLGDAILPLDLEQRMLRKKDFEKPETFEINYPIGDQVKTLLLNIVPVKAADQNVIYGIGQEITHYKKDVEQLRYLSLHDPVTGLFNRAYFEQEMSRLDAGRNVPASIVLCDLDGLKFINDTLGHDKGDALIMVAADILRDCFRGGDMVARIGGDEFAILFPNGERNVVENICRRVRWAVANHNKVSPDLPLSISIGYATRSGDGKNMNDLFKEADNNMYREKLQHSQRARGTIIKTLFEALKTKDFITTEQVVKFRQLVGLFGTDVGLSDTSVSRLRLLAQFHDIGKVGLPEDILFKPGPLTAEEAAEMRRHCEIGHRLALSTPDLFPIADWILKHHEWWNGNGYPLGLKGIEIPLECRILAIANAYMAMVSFRPYRDTLSREQARIELVNYAGIQFDPQLVARFIEFMEVRAG
ncbi:diguanylate cyclase domain-containing protein [Desulfoscipio sp. XC116]|uniref:diguanylate cyclase domain-containing protein n=1 Tax=Desulfoscipio sp. XC116 TaxID=3144975 RepID=UPI00325A8115